MKKKGQEIFLASQVFFLADIALSLGFLLHISFFQNFLNNNCFFFMTNLKKKAKKISWLAKFITWQFCWFFEKVALKKKRPRKKKIAKSGYTLRDRRI